MRRDSNAHRQKYALSVAGGGHGHEHEKQCHRAQDHRVHPDVQSALQWNTPCVYSGEAGWERW